MKNVIINVIMVAIIPLSPFVYASSSNIKGSDFLHSTVTLPSSFDVNCVTEKKFSKIGAILESGNLIISITPTHNHCTFIAVANITPNQENQIAESGDTLLMSSDGTLLPGCAAIKPFVVENGANIDLTRESFDCPSICDQKNYMPCDKN